AAPRTPPRAEKEESTLRKWAVPAAIVAGGAVVVGGAVAIAGSGGGGGSGGGSSTNAPDGTYSGNYAITFSGTDTNGVEVVKTRNDLASAYFKDGSVKLVGLWGGTTLSGSCPSRTFTISSSVPAYGEMPASHLVVAGEVSGKKCTLVISGYSTEAGNAGELTGNATLSTP
ncbi:MAG: hypothetical protein IJS32_09045, partial [Kiritimatiellae bacterium]|nr:hypothetical protein [Kiritimatiellia bacterium]